MIIVESVREVYDEGHSNCAVGAPVFQVEEEMEELREILKRRPDEEEEEKHEEREAGSSSIRTASSCRSPVKKKDVDACWQAAEQKFLTAQDLGNNYVHTVSMVTRLST